MRILAAALAVGLLGGWAAAAARFGLSVPVTVSVQQAPVDQLLDAVSRQAKVNFILADDVSGKKISASLRGVPASSVLSLLDAQGLGYRRIGQSNTYLVAAKDSVALRARAPVAGGQELDRIVTVRLKGAPLSELAMVLGRRTGARFAVDPALSGRRVTIFLENVTARETLDAVAALKGLSCRQTGAKPDSYVIEPAS